MSAATDIWMPLYIGDYVGSTMHLTTAQHGAYLLLLMAAWKSGGSLPAKDASLAAIAKMTKREWLHERDTLSEFFEITNEAWTHRRVAKELVVSAENSRRKSELGIRAANARWHPNNAASGEGYAKGNACSDAARIADGIPPALPTGCPSPSPSPSPSRSSVMAESVPRSGTNRPKGSTHGKSGSRIPATWRPGSDGRAFAAERGLDPDATADAFVDWWTACSGPKCFRDDWDASFRTWCRRASEDGRAVARTFAARAPKGNDAFFEHLADIATRDQD